MLAQTYQSNTIQIVPQVIYQVQPLQYQVVIPIEQPEEEHVESECYHHCHHECNHEDFKIFENASFSDEKKEAGDCLLSSRVNSAANTQASN